MNVKCACGFEVTGDDTNDAVTAFEAHQCPDMLSDTRWHDNVFSFWGAVLLDRNEEVA